MSGGAGENLRWYALHTKAQQEERAESNLIAWRVETYVPRIKERRRGRASGLDAYSIKTLFPRYIFARFDADRMLHKVSYTRGVQSVVNFGGVPVPVDDEVVEIMRGRAGEDGYIRIGDELKAGDRVMIQDGAFKNFVGVFERQLAVADRVRILLTTINYRSHITIDRALVRKLDPSYLPA